MMPLGILVEDVGYTFYINEREKERGTERERRLGEL